MERQPFFEVSITRKGIGIGIALAIALLLSWGIPAVVQALWEKESLVAPALIWCAFGYVTMRLIFERHSRAALSILAALFLLGLCLSSWVIPYDPVSDVSQFRSEGPSWAHYLGTDYLGRDMLVRLIKGTEGFFLPGLLAMVIALIAGVSLGAIAGYVGGRADKAITFLTTLIGSFPRLVFILLVCTIPEEPDMYLIGSLVGVLFIPQVSEAIRRRVLALKAEDFIVASTAHGIGFARILFYHIVWLQCFPELVRQGLFIFVYMIFLETSLSYLEFFGVPAEVPSWGKMLNNATALMFRGTYWHALVPTAAIVFTTLGVTALGDVVVGGTQEERL